MHRTIRTAVAALAAAALMALTASVAPASATSSSVTEFDNIAIGDNWWLESPTEITTDVQATQKTETRNGSFSSYNAQIQQPINPNGSSTWPAKRGVIPVQFKLTASPTTEQRTVTTTTTTITKVPSFKSIGSDAVGYNDWSALTHVPPAKTKVSDIHDLTANYTWVTGNHHGGSLRWVINTPGGPIWVHFGQYPNFGNDGNVGGPGMGANMIAQTDARFDASSRGGPVYATWADILNLYGNDTVDSIALTIDGGWKKDVPGSNGNGDQEVNLSSVVFNGVIKDIEDSYTGGHDTVEAWSPGSPDVTSDANTAQWVPGPTGTPVQTNVPSAYIKVKKFNDGVGYEVVNETLSSAQGDDSGKFRQIDGKYMYNLKIESLTGAGDYMVYMDVNGDGTLEEAPGVFSLK